MRHVASRHGGTSSRARTCERNLSFFSYLLLVAGYSAVRIRPQDLETVVFGADRLSRSTVLSFWGAEMAKRKRWLEIPTELSIERFREFVLPHLTVGSRGPAPKLSLHALFNYILKLLYLGCQWKELPIERDDEGRREAIPASGASFADGRRMAVSMRSSPGRC